VKPCLIAEGGYDMTNNELDWRELDLAIARFMNDQDELTPYSSDLNATREMEEEIKRRDLMHHYILELMAICAPNLALGGAPTYGDLWNMTHALAADRCRAALRALIGRQ
jgi:hypothetical protein